MTLLRPSLFIFLASLSACSKTPTTPAGPLGEIDLRGKLPAGVAAPEASQLEAYETSRVVCEVPGTAEGADLKLKWKAFKVGAASYVASVSVEVVKPADALEVQLRDVAEGNSNLSPGGAFAGMAEVSISCYRKAFRLEQRDSASIQLKSDGTAPLPKALKAM